jgi:hypothetical protein
VKCMAREREARARSDSAQLDDQSLLVGRELQEQCRLRHVGGGGGEGGDYLERGCSQNCSRESGRRDPEEQISTYCEIKLPFFFRCAGSKALRALCAPRALHRAK